MVSGHRRRKKLQSRGCPEYVNVYIYMRDVTCRSLLLYSSLIKDDCWGNYCKGRENQGLLILYCCSLIAWNNGTWVSLSCMGTHKLLQMAGMEHRG